MTNATPRDGSPAAGEQRPNVFTAGLRPNDEDRFTAYWHVVLDWYPVLGQQVVDYIASRAGIPSSPFLGSDDHPRYSDEDRPDFRLRTAAYDLICEHKLDAALGPEQLERYCALAAGAAACAPPGRRAYVLLIAAAPTAVPAAVLADPRYLRPRDGAVAHFRWEDVFRVVRGYADGAFAAGDRDGRLAREFADHMAARGFTPWACGPWGDPLVAGSDAAAQFRDLWRVLLPRYRGPGRLAKRDRLGLGFEWRMPVPDLPAVSLIHVQPIRAPNPPHPHVQGRAISCRVWQRAIHVGTEAELPAADRAVVARPGAPPIYARTPAPRDAASVPGSVLVREYVAPLAGVLAADRVTSEARLHAFVAACVADLRDEAAVTIRGDSGTA